jgi:DNA gyrase subunit B
MAEELLTETMEKTSQSNYTSENIQVLEGLEAVRKRPAMYIGDIGVRGLHHLVYEVVDNSIDEALAGYCKNIQVFINEDNSITVKDDGRGIPTDMHKKEKRSALEVVMTVLHAGGKFNKDTYKVSGGLHGVGVSCVNALSSHLIVTVHREGQIFQQEYSIGKPLYDVKVIGTTDRTGTEVTFLPDTSIFTVSQYNYSTLAGRMCELAYLNKGIAITLTDKREKDENDQYLSERFFSEKGLIEFVRYLDGNREKLLSEPIVTEGSRDNVMVEIALTYILM